MQEVTIGMRLAKPPFSSRFMPSKLLSSLGRLDFGGSAVNLSLIGNTKALPLWKRWLFALILTDFMRPLSSSKITLPIDEFLTPKYRANFISLLEEHLPLGILCPELKALLNPEELKSYTTLWLDTLLKGTGLRSAETLQEGSQVGNQRYEIIEQIGSGGQGTAYKARVLIGLHSELKTGDQIVLKEFVIPADAGIKTSQRMLNNISREAELLRILQHKNIAEDQRSYLVLNHIDGCSLRSLVEREGALSEHEVLKLAVQMCEILAHLHEQIPAVIHRDFTPENLMLQPNGELTLIDFNVAQQCEANKTNTVVGKHSYMPVEQFRGTATTQSDIYALGATMFYLLCGKDPAAITQSHPKQHKAGLSPDIDGIVSRATAQSIDERYTDVSLLKQDLLTAQDCLTRACVSEAASLEAKATTDAMAA